MFGWTGSPAQATSRKADAATLVAACREEKRAPGILTSRWECWGVRDRADHAIDARQRQPDYSGPHDPNTSGHLAPCRTRADDSGSFSTISRLNLDWSPVIHLRLLGGASVERDGVPLAGSVMQRRRVALLALLASAPASGSSRDRLATLLFPEADATRAHRALSDALHAVRKALGRNVVVAAGDSLSLNAEVIQSDVDSFRRRLDAGELEAAVTTYRGAFLDGFFVPDALELERWIEDERARLAALFAEALESLAVGTERGDNPSGAIRWWRSLAAHDPHNSRVSMRFATALAAADDRAGAVRQLQEHATRLREELSVEPGTEVHALIAELQSHSAAPVASSASQHSHRVEPAAPAAPLSEAVVRQSPGFAEPRGRRRVGWLAAAALGAT